MVLQNMNIKYVPKSLFGFSFVSPRFFLSKAWYSSGVFIFDQFKEDQNPHYQTFACPIPLHKT